MLTMACVERSKPRAAYATSKLSASIRTNFNIAVGSGLFSCGAVFTELKWLTYIYRKNHISIQAVCSNSIRANLPNIAPAEALSYPGYCVHYVSKRCLQKTENEYPISKPCKEGQKSISNEKENKITAAKMSKLETDLKFCFYFN